MSAKLCGIYCIENKINGKKYIGQSKDIHTRWRQHKSSYSKKCPALQNAFDKYGYENFLFYILEECEENELNNLEQYYIDKLDALVDGNKGYNISKGGICGASSSSISKKKMRLLMKTKRDVSGEYLGVHFSKIKNKFIAKIIHNGTTIYLGSFKSEISAAYFYNQKAKELFSDHAILNNVPEINLYNYIQISKDIFREGKVDTTSKYFGVSFNKKKNKYVARVNYKGKRIYLGEFEKEKDAAIFYNHVAFKLLGNDAILNNIPNWESMVEGIIENKNKQNTSRFRGVSFVPDINKYKSKITINGHSIYLGCFDNEEDAAIAYNNKAVELLGQKAKLNDIPNWKNKHIEIFQKKEKFRGVYYVKSRQYYTAYINHNKKSYYLGNFDNEIDAAIAYNNKALEFLGDKAVLNIIPEKEVLI